MKAICIKDYGNQFKTMRVYSVEKLQHVPKKWSKRKRSNKRFWKNWKKKRPYRVFHKSSSSYTVFKVKLFRKYFIMFPTTKKRGAAGQGGITNGQKKT